jgi:hypothetical protein
MTPPKAEKNSKCPASPRLQLPPTARTPRTQMAKLAAERRRALAPDHQRAPLLRSQGRLLPPHSGTTEASRRSAARRFSPGRPQQPACPAIQASKACPWSAKSCALAAACFGTTPALGVQRRLAFWRAPCASAGLSTRGGRGALGVSRPGSGALRAIEGQQVACDFQPQAHPVSSAIAAAQSGHSQAPPRNSRSGLALADLPGKGSIA